jgi:hypothetical protein
MRCPEIIFNENNLHFLHAVEQNTGQVGVVTSLSFARGSAQTQLLVFKSKVLIAVDVAGTAAPAAQ